MAIAISHTFVSAKADGGDTSLVQPSNWNAAHSLTGFGTGVETALAVNVGSAGAFVTNGGALGTPSGGTLTNCTGLPAAGVAGTAAILGANTFTALQTITQASANAGIIASTGYSLTGSNTVGAFDLVGTWNSTGQTDFFALRLTDTARHASSKVVNVYAGAAGATSIFSLDRVGNIVFGSSHPYITDSQSTINFGPFNGDVSIGNFSGLTGVGGTLFCANGIGNFTRSLYAFGWTNSSSDSKTTVDTALHRDAAGVVAIDNGTAGTYRDLIARTLQVAPSSTNGQKLGLTELTELTTIAAAATTDTTIQMPAGAIVLAVSVRVTTVIPDATSFDVGDSGSATRFSTASVGVAANSTDAGTKAGAYYNASALSVRLTMNGTPPAANTGRVRVTIFYFLSTPPTS